MLFRQLLRRGASVEEIRLPGPRPLHTQRMARFVRSLYYCYNIYSVPEKKGIMDTNTSRAALLSVGTAVPPYKIDQAQLCDWMIAAFSAEPSLARWLRYLYRASGITTRYSCLSDAELAPEQSRFAPSRNLHDTPTTAERMAIYERFSVELGLGAAQQALREHCQNSGLDEAQLRDSITHLIVVSCTGFFAPGLDFVIARELGLQPAVQRTLVGFMGCAAAFNALRLADQIVRADGNAQVLVVCVELCSLHVQAGTDRVNLTVGALFADGAAACLVGRPQTEDGDYFLINHFHTHMLPATEADMAWKIANHGFIMGLSPEIPRLLGAVAPGALERLFGQERPAFWAIHPGGRSIVEQLESVFALRPAELEATRTVLRNYGNMSSATILFVLNELREQLRATPNPSAQDGVAMAFGPGLVTEMVRLSYTPALQSQIEHVEVVNALA